MQDISILTRKFPIDHDLHCHTRLSSCSQDPEQTTDAILDNAAATGLSLQAVTDHYWDRSVPGASSWYESQDFDHISQSRPLAQRNGIRFLFGCECEWCGGGKLSIPESRFGEFDFIVVPPNHFHMVGLTRKPEIDTPEKIAGLLLSRLEELTEKNLPWEKVGIAHLNCNLLFHEGDVGAALRAVCEDRFRAVARKIAALGAGIELNTACFCENVSRPDISRDDELRLFRMAKEEGCRFYIGSDAHHPKDFSSVRRFAPEVVDALGLDSRHLFRPPASDR